MQEDHLACQEVEHLVQEVVDTLLGQSKEQEELVVHCWQEEVVQGAELVLLGDRGDSSRTVLVSTHEATKQSTGQL